MYDCNGKLLLAAVLAIGSATAVQNAWGQDTGLQFRGSEAVVSPVDVWTGDGWFNIGQSPLMHAKLRYFDSVYEKSDGDAWIGTESGTVDFGDGDQFQLACRFVLEYVTNPEGVGRILSTCSIVSGKGLFQNASGTVTDIGSWGPGMSFPGQTPDGQTWYATGEITGIILGVDPKAITDKLTRTRPPT